MGTKRKFDVCTPRPKFGEEGKSWWHRVGNAVENDKGQITIYLNSIPVPDPTRENQVVMMLFEPREDDRAAAPAAQSSPSRSKRQQPKEDEDYIPF